MPVRNLISIRVLISVQHVKKPGISAAQNSVNMLINTLFREHLKPLFLNFITYLNQIAGMKASQLKIAAIATVILFCSAGAFAQKTLVNTDPVHIFNEALDLYKSEKYSAAIQRFNDFKESGSSYLLTMRSDLYIALSAKELRLQNTVDLFLYYLNTYPDQASESFVYFHISKYYFDKRDYDECLSWLKKIPYPGTLRLDLFYEFNFMAGYCYYKEDDLDKALGYFTKIDAARNPYFEIANYYSGYIYYKQGSYEKALDRFLKIKDERKFARLLPVYITHIYLNLEHYTQAIKYGNNALETPKVQKTNEIKSYLAQAYFFNRNYPKAIEYYEELNNTGFSFTSNDYYYYGYSLFKNQEFKKAVDQFSHLTVAKNALGQNIAYLSAVCYLQLDEKLKARNSFGFAAVLDYDKTMQENAFLNFAKLSFELNFHKESINALRNFITKFPDSKHTEEARNLISEILLSTANYKEAINIIESMENTNSNIKKAYQKVTYYYALEKLENGEFKNAETYFIKSVKTPMDDKMKALAYFWLGESYYKQDEYENAIREYKNFLYVSEAKSTSYYSASYYNIGYANYKLAEYEQAKTYFDRYLELEKQNKPTNRLYDVIVRLADCNFALKDYQEALKYYKLTVTQKSQEVVYALFQEATLFGLLGDDDKKLETLEILISDYPNSAYVDDALFEIANMDFIAGKFATAKAKFNNLVTKYPRSPYLTSAMLKIALADYNLGKDDLALEEFKTIIKQFPYAPESKEAINAAKNIYLDRGEADALFKFLKSIPKVNLTVSFQDSATYTAAFNYVKKEKYKEAIVELDKYLEKFPEGYFVVNANYYLASCADYLDRKDKALTHYENVNSMSPNTYVEKSLKAAASIYYDNLDYEKAAERFKQLEEIAVVRENNLLALQGQMRCYFKLSSFNNCITYADKVINLTFSSDDNKLEANYYKAKSNFELKNYETAATLLNLVADNNTADMGAESKYLIAYIYYLKEDYDNSVNTILELKNTFPGNDYYLAKGFILLSDVFVKMGDLFQARHTLESIIANYEGEQLVELAKQKLEKIAELEEKANRSLLNNEDNFIEMESDSIK